MSDGNWLTYKEAAKELFITPDSVRRRDDRGKLQRVVGRDRVARVFIAKNIDDLFNLPNAYVSDDSIWEALRAYHKVSKEILNFDGMRAAIEAAFKYMDGKR